MRSLRRLLPALDATPTPRDLWRVATVEHHAALVRVRDALAAVVAMLTQGDAPDPDAILALGYALDESESAASGGGTRRAPAPDDRDLIRASDLVKRLLPQLRQFVLHPRQNWHRRRWEDHLLDTLGEAAALVLPPDPEEPPVAGVTP